MKPLTAIRGLPFVVGLLNLDLNLSIAVILTVSNALTKSFLFDTIYPNLNRLQPRSQGLSSSQRETLVWAGHPSMYTNEITIGGWIFDLIWSTLSMEVKVALLLYLES